MHRVDAQIAGLALRIGLAPLADRDRRGPGFTVVEPSLAIARAGPQVVEMAVGNLRQTLELALAVDLELALQNGPRGRPGERLMGLIDGGQQFDVGPRVALRETPPPILHHPHPTGGRIAVNQPRDLRPTQPGHLLKIASQQPPRHLALPQVLMLDEQALHPAIHLLAMLTLKADPFAGRYQQTNLLQTQLLRFVHADLQSSA